MPSDETKKNPLNLRRKLISSESFSLGKSRIGTILNGIDIVDRRSLNNSRKITSIKNIIKSRGGDLAENLKSVSPDRLKVLDNIDSLLASMKEDERKRKENERRKLEESRLETRYKKLKQTTEKILSPVRGVLDRIVKAFIAILTGRFLVKLVEWLSNPSNQKKVNAILRFLTDFGPKLLSLYILFGTRFGRAIRSLSGLIIKGGLRIGAATLLLLRKMGFKRAGMMARSLLGRSGRRIATGLQIGAATAGFFGLNSLFGGGLDGGGGSSSDQVDREILDQNQDIKDAYEAGLTHTIGMTALESLPVVGPIGALAVDFARGNYNEGGLVYTPPVDFDPSLIPAPTGGGGGTNALTEQAKVKTFGMAIGDAIQGFFGITPKRLREDAQYLSGGGKVEGRSGIDKVPAMLTQGEFVMSRGAVQKFGVKNLMEMNAAGGGTNKPRFVRDTVYAQGGGIIGNPFAQKGLARGTRATAGFTGMNKAGFDAVSGGSAFRPSSKPQILGRGAYSAPTAKGAQRYAGTSGSLGGRQMPGGVVKSIVPGGAPRIPFIEPQMKVSAPTFDRGRMLANKLQGGAYPRSPLANRLRGQMSSGVGRLPRLKIGGGNLIAMLPTILQLLPGPVGDRARMAQRDIDMAKQTALEMGLQQLSSFIRIPEPPTRGQPKVIVMDGSNGVNISEGANKSNSFTTPTLRNRSANKMVTMGIE